MTTYDALRQATTALGRAGVHHAGREAVWLLEHVTGMGHAALVAVRDRTLTRGEAARLKRLVAARSRRYPLQYLLGSVPFAGVHLVVSPAVLIPRPETEELAELAQSLVAGRPGRLRCADLGTGSGCIAIALAHAMPASRWHASDISADALEVACANAKANGVARRMAFRQGFWFTALPAAARYDLVVANPPYVAKGTPLEPELAHEPQEALYAGCDGLEAYREILAGLRGRLKPDGWFAGEIGLGQGRTLRALARAEGFTTVSCRRDLTGRERFLVLR